MKKGDLIWGAAFVAFVLFVVMPGTHALFVTFTTNHPLLGGFIKFAILASMGELMAIRIATGDYRKPPALLFRSLIWGFLGIVITLIFNIFATGVMNSLDKGMLPGAGTAIAFAFFTSAIMNLTFAPTFMAFHRFTDTYLDMRFGEMRSGLTVDQVLERIDWKGFVTFVVMKTIPFFWIPAHTITFLLPPAYRVLVAAFLSIALGAILSFAKKMK